MMHVDSDCPQMRSLCLSGCWGVVCTYVGRSLEAVFVNPIVIAFVGDLFEQERCDGVQWLEMVE